MTREWVDNTSPVPESDTWSSRGEVPGSIVPGWKILVGSSVAIGAAVGLFELTRQMLEIRNRTHK